MNMLSMILAGPAPMTPAAKAALRTVGDGDFLRGELPIIKRCSEIDARVLVVLFRAHVVGTEPLSLTSIAAAAHCMPSTARGALPRLLALGLASFKHSRTGARAHLWRLKDGLDLRVLPDERQYVRPDVYRVLREACELYQAIEEAGEFDAGSHRAFCKKPAKVSNPRGARKADRPIDDDVAKLSAQLICVGQRLREAQDLSSRARGHELERTGFELMQWQNTRRES